jgi:hypothetical protein
MKIRKLLLIAFMSASISSLVSCSKDDTPTAAAKKEYPEGAIIWKEGTTVNLKESFIIKQNETLYIEEGVQVIMEANKGLEIIVLGNLYAYGTAAKPIRFSVPEKDRTDANRFARLWGGIICGYDSKEVLLQHSIVEYGGAQTTEESESFKYKLFKTETGEGVPGFHFCNIDGKFVVDNCTFRNNAEDHIYITGGKSIIMKSTFYHSGFDGGEAINYKSDCLADLAYNLIYDANTNAFKLSNSGLQSTQSHLFVYNNTVVNTGWRRPKIKGGSVWLEDNIRTEIFNNILFDNRHAVKRDVKLPEDNRTVITPNFLFASTAAGVEELKANDKTGILAGSKDKVSTTAGSLNPNFNNFNIQSNIDIMVGITNSGNVPQKYNTAWDFHLKAGSPALTGGTTSIVGHFNTTGLTIDKKVYNSPAPSSYFGAFGQK